MIIFNVIYDSLPKLSPLGNWIGYGIYCGLQVLMFYLLWKKW